MSDLNRTRDKNHCYITEVDGSICDLWAFKFTRQKTILKWISYFFTVFLLRLIFHWLPNWKIRYGMCPCEVKDADKLLIKDSSGVFYIVSVNHEEPPESDLSFTVSDAPDFLSVQSDEKHQDEESWIFYKNLKYVLDKADGHYYFLPSWDERLSADIVNAQPLIEAEVKRRRYTFGINDIPIPLRSIGLILLTEGLNPFYVFQAASCLLWFSDDYYYYASAIVVISAISLSWTAFETRRSEKALRETVVSYGEISVCRERNNIQEYFTISSMDLVPGDIIEIPQDGCLMFCDAVLLQGNCIVNESTLTGESVPVTKIPFVAPSKRGAASPPFDLKASSKSALYCGTSVIQTRNLAGHKAIAVVVRTGFRTAKGEMVRAILFPKPMKFKFTRDVHKFVAALSTLAFVGFCISIYIMVRNGYDASLIARRALDLITIAVPPALPVAMTVGVSFAQNRLKKRSIFCMNPSVINVCGVINVACFDKTGTITEDGLDLWGVIPNGDGQFAESLSEPEKLPRGPLLETMASCHSLTRIEGELSGDPLDLKMFLSTNWEMTEEISEDHCKFEMTIPAIVRPPTPPPPPKECDTTVEANPYEIGIIRQFPFSSTLQRMSVIARALNGTHFSVYTKGSPEMIETLCRKETLPRDFHKVLMEYTCEGYRVIALAWRPLRVAYTRVMRLQRDSIEKQLHFLGLLIMENRLKPESAPVIKLLKQANIKPVMVTGDNMLTALSVARDCEMIDETDRIIIVSAKPPIPQQLTPPDHFIDVPNGLGNQGDLEETWGDLVQFHYAEDLHRPVTEVTATTTSTAVRQLQKQQKVSSTIEDGELDRGHRRSGLSKWFPFIRKRRHSKNLNALDLESGPRLTGDEATTNKTLKNGRLPPAAAFSRLGHQIRSRGRVKPRYHSTTSISLRMVDRPDFHLALSGKTWAIIREHFPALIPKLVVKGTVFARFSPEQKTQLIESLQSVGYFVSMCGDGANDCGALKAAHAGIGLSQAEASVASPFTAAQQNIACVPQLIREGRCALGTSFGTFKFMMGYSVTQFTSVLMLYWVKSSLSDMQFLYIDLFLITSLGITFGYTKAYPILSADPPVMRLLSAPTLISLGSQLVLVIVTQLTVFLYTRAQSWYIDYCGIDMELNRFNNFDNTALFLVSMFQYISLAIIFSNGPPYRRRLYTNFLFLGNVLVALGVNFIFAFYDSESLMNWISIRNFPSSQMRIIIVLAALINFFIGFLVEIIVDGVAFRRHIHHIKKALFPRHVARKDYERIREEIDRMVGVWPPIIRSASIQDIRAEFFGEEAIDRAERSRHWSGGDRSRNTSTTSTCFDGEMQEQEETMVNTIAGVGVTATPSRRRYLDVSGNRGRCRSLGASELRDLMEECEVETAKAQNPKKSTEESSPTVEEEANFGVLGKSEMRRLRHVYPSRMRSKSSSCDKQIPSEVDKTRVLPLRNPGLS